MSLRTIQLAAEWAGCVPREGEEVKVDLKQQMEAMTEEELDACIAVEEACLRLHELRSKVKPTGQRRLRWPGTSLKTSPASCVQPDCTNP